MARPFESEEDEDPLSFIVEADIEKAEVRRQHLIVLGAKLRTAPHPRLSSGGPEIVAATNAPFEACMNVAQVALARPESKTRNKAPRNWPPEQHYSGILLRDPFSDKAPVTVQDVDLLSKNVPIPDEYWLVGFGWIEIVKNVEKPNEVRTWLQDKNRELEISLLRILVEDPIARQQIVDYHTKDLDLPGGLLKELLGNTNWWWETELPV